MSAPNSVSKSIEYSTATIARAQRAIRCSPFQIKLLTDSIDQSVKLSAISGNRGVELGYTRSPLPELRAENALLWLIQVGVLRREVDGQGITDSFRLTPLGRKVAERLAADDINNSKPPSWGDRLSNALNRYLRLPL
ncbi:Npun_F0494 family protein [Limnospira platensis CENA597]|uniref:Npun_F0494 family protein n=1 Tax=Limnospira platensis TaxID=118562 RepID=UPI003D6F2F37